MLSEKAMATHSSTVAWRIPGMGETGGLPSMGSHGVRHDWSDLAAAAKHALSFLNILKVKTAKEFLIRIKIIAWMLNYVSHLIYMCLYVQHCYPPCSLFIAVWKTNVSIKLVGEDCEVSWVYLRKKFQNRKIIAKKISIACKKKKNHDSYHIRKSRTVMLLKKLKATILSICFCYFLCLFLWFRVHVSCGYKGIRITEWWKFRH